MALLEILSLAADTHATLARKLVSSAGERSSEFKELLEQVETARANVQRARAELEQHRKQHREN